MIKIYKVVALFNSTGDQPQAIENLAEGLGKGLAAQVLLGSPEIIQNSSCTFTNVSGLSAKGLKRLVSIRKCVHKIQSVV